MPWHGIYDEREELVFMGMKHFIHLLSSCWEGVVLWNTILSCLVIVVGACHRSMVRGGAHCACLAATAAREMILLALPCLAVQHNMHQMW